MLNLVLDEDTIIVRLSLRRSCPQCGAVYHIRNNPPKVDEVCDECGARLVQRSDDREEIVRHRLKVYEAKARSLLERYRKSGKMRDVPGDLNIDDIPNVVRRLL